ncbi:MAG TPA: lysozyme inhibitor LprI family protein [Candidatus Sulfotelmatobacter sp.]|jgi:uncharacterized protein YecT (DUF1311 family)|nr:lysozyme inhibitor LprI family protein [Candidatus Sulfotelmatobacter sp.]
MNKFLTLRHSREMKFLMTLILATAFVLAGCSTSPSKNGPDSPGSAEISQETERYALADAELNRTYNELLNHLAKDQQELLRKAESSWIIMRDAQADLVVSRTGGWGRTAGYYSSLTRFTQARTRDLKELFSDE